MTNLDSEELLTTINEVSLFFLGFLQWVDEQVCSDSMSNHLSFEPFKVKKGSSTQTVNKREAAHTKTGASNDLKSISKITTRGAKGTCQRSDCVSTGQKLEMVRKPVKHFFRFVVAMELN